MDYDTVHLDDPKEREYLYQRGQAPTSLQVLRASLQFAYLHDAKMVLREPLTAEDL